MMEEQKVKVIVAQGISPTLAREMIKRELEQSVIHKTEEIEEFLNNIEIVEAEKHQFDMFSQDFPQMFEEFQLIEEFDMQEPEPVDNHSWKKSNKKKHPAFRK